jgi:hypothetical protein
MSLGCRSPTDSSDSAAAEKTATANGRDELLLADVSEFERSILEDGFVTPAEHEAAVLAVLACLDEAGIAHSEPTPGLVPWGVPNFTYTWSYAPSDEQSASGSYDECYRTYEDDVVLAWKRQEEPSGAELDAAKERVVSCARERGIEVEDFDELLATLRDAEVFEVFRDCQDIVALEMAR